MAMDAGGEGLRMQHAWDRAWQGDGRVGIKFHKQTVLNERKTSGWIEEREIVGDDGIVTVKKIRHAGAGRPIYDEKDFCQKFTPGDSTNIVDQEATDEDKVTYEKEWTAYLAGNEQSASGTPLDVWTQLPRAMAEELKHLPGAPVRTVEELAAMPDVHLQRFQGLSSWKQKARDFLAAAQSAAPMEAMRVEISQRDTEIATLKEQVAALMAASKQEKPQGKPQR